MRIPLRTQDGFSMVEGLVAIAMIGGVFVATMSVFQTMSASRPSMVMRSCDLYARSVVQAVEEETLYRQLVNFVPTPGDRTVDASAFTATRAVPNVNDYFTTSEANAYLVSQPPGAANDGLVAGTGSTLQAHQLLQGSVRSLAAIYNNNPQVRCQFGNYAPLGNPAVAPPGSLAPFNPQVDVRIDPYDRVTGAAMCGASVNPRPQGMRANDPNQSAYAVGSGAQGVPGANEEYDPVSPSQPPTFNANARIANPGLGLVNQGLELVVRVRYQREGANIECKFGKKFEYPTDRSEPLPPDIARVVSNTTVPRPSCPSGNPVQRNVAIEVGFSGTPERGFQLLCRDLSWRQGWQPNPGPSHSYPACIIGGVLRPEVLVHAPDPALQTFPRDNRWVPCDQLRQCGLAPISVSYPYANPNVNASGHVITLNYQAMPFGCTMNFEAVSVDSAGNTSLSVARSFAENAGGGVTQMNRIWYGTCQGGAPTICGLDQGPGYYADFPNGYYTCNPACCVGVGCTAYN